MRQDKDNKLIYEMYAEASSRPANGTPTAVAGSGETVIISPWVLQHIETQHGQGPGQGSIFNRVPSTDELADAIASVDISNPTSGALYEIPIQDIGYDLVDTTENAMNLPGAQKGESFKEERGEQIPVVAVTTSSPVRDFASNIMTLVLRPTAAEYLPDDLKQDEEILGLVEQGKVYALLSAWPGKATVNGVEVPPASKWGEDYAVIIPE